MLKTFWFEETFNQKKKIAKIMNEESNEVLGLFSIYILKATQVHYTQKQSSITSKYHMGHIYKQTYYLFNT